MRYPVCAFAKRAQIAYLHAMSNQTLQQRLEIARQHCEAAGERFTPLREHVLELVIEDGGAVKAYDLIDRLKPDRGSPKPPTIYRALDFLSRLGLVHRVEALNAFIACRHDHSTDLAEFFICETCKTVQERHAHDHTECKPDGFTIRRSVVEHYGLCADCRAA
jgi:Fur family zinc uptake transcriptional regulator